MSHSHLIQLILNYQFRLHQCRQEIDQIALPPWMLPEHAIHKCTCPALLLFWYMRTIFPSFQDILAPLSVGQLWMMWANRSPKFYRIHNTPAEKHPRKQNENLYNHRLTTITFVFQTGIWYKRNETLGSVSNMLKPNKISLELFFAFINPLVHYHFWNIFLLL